MDLTRRNFIKVSSVFLCNGLFPVLGTAINFSCPECNALNLYADKCFSCGRGLRYGIKCNGCVKKYNCLQIPFPNHSYLIDTDKPFLSMKVVNF